MLQNPKKGLKGRTREERSDLFFFTRNLKRHSDKIFSTIAESLQNISLEENSDNSIQKVLGFMETCKGMVKDKDAIDEIIKKTRNSWFKARYGTVVRSSIENDDWLGLGALAPYLLRELRAMGFSHNAMHAFYRKIFNDMGVYQAMRNPNHPDAAAYMVNWKRLYHLDDEMEFRVNAQRAKLKGITRDALKGVLKLPTIVYYNGIKYSILELLGSGRGGFAYRAQDEDGKNVVVKFILPSNLDDQFDFFGREIGALKITNRFIHADMENRVLIFKMIPGITFAKYLTQFSQKFSLGYKSDADFNDLLVKVRSYFSALKEFNQKHGLLHGDVRPSNIIITPDGKMELIDLGQCELSPLDPEEFSEIYRYQCDMSKLELYYWVSRAFKSLKDTNLAADHRHLMILQATPGRESEAEKFCQYYQGKHNLPTDTCQILRKEHQDLQSRVKELVNQSSPKVEDLNALAKKLRTRFMFIEEGTIDMKLSSLQ